MKSKKSSPGRYITEGNKIGPIGDHLKDDPATWDKTLPSSMVINHLWGISKRPLALYPKCVIFNIVILSYGLKACNSSSEL